MGEAAKTLEIPGLVVLTPEQLTTLVTNAVKNANADAESVPEYLTIKKVGEWLDADPRTVRQWIETEGLRAIRIGPREWRLMRADVIAWLESRTTKPGGHSAKHVERLKRAKVGA